MRVTLLVAIISVTSAWRRLLVEDDGSELSFKEAWKKFRHDFGVHDEHDPSHNGLKKHVKKEVRQKRKENFRKIFDMVREHNKRYRRGEVTYDLAINEFADLTFEEMRFMTGDVDEPEGADDVGEPDGVSPDGRRRAEMRFGDRDTEDVDRGNFQSSVDDLDHVKVSGSYINWHATSVPIRDQGDCGSCWAFASASMIENRLHWSKGWNGVSLSHQEMVDCVEPYGSDECQLDEGGKTYRGGCCGSWPYKATSYVEEHGIASTGETNYIQDESKKCTRDPSKKGGLAPGMVKAQRRKASGEGDLEDIVRGGAVAVSFRVHDDMRFYNSGVYTPDHTTKVLGGHAVVLLGFKDDYWILQNSWGSDWGENGYFRMKKGVNAGDVGLRGHWSWVSVPSYTTIPQAPTGGGPQCGTVRSYSETGTCNTKCAKGTSQVCKWHSGCGWVKDCYKFGDHWTQRNSKLCRHDNGYLYAQEECCQCLHFDPSSKLSTYHDYLNYGPRGDDAKADLSLCKGMGYRKVAGIGFRGWDEYFFVDGVKYWSFTQYECLLSSDKNSRRLEEAENLNIDDDVWLKLDDPAIDDPTLGGNEELQLIPRTAANSTGLP